MRESCQARVLLQELTRAARHAVWSRCSLRTTLALSPSETKGKRVALQLRIHCMRESGTVRTVKCFDCMLVSKGYPPACPSVAASRCDRFSSKILIVDDRYMLVTGY